jgi:glucose/arabinose dehydrogenase
MMSMKRTARAVSAAMSLVALATVASANTPLADPIPAKIQQSNIAVKLQLVASGLAAPNFLTGAGDGTGRRFIVDQNGKIRLVMGDGTLQATPFMDVATGGLLGSDVFAPGGSAGEKGLLGLAFHPDFAHVGTDGYGKFYTYTSVNRTTSTDFDDGLSNTATTGPRTDHQSVINEWTMSNPFSNTASTATRREVMRLDEPQSNHNGGMLAFAPDGYMYVGLGDGGQADDGNTATANGHGTNGNGQNTLTVLGKILRIDPLNPTSHVTADPVSGNGKYRNAASNPYDGVVSGTGYDGQHGLKELYAIGLRNPFRFSFDPTTHMFVIGDVGQNSVEEVDRINYLTGAGTNFGWRIKEGSFNFDPDSTNPGFVYNDGPPIYPDPAHIPTLTDPVAQYDHDEGIAVIGGFIYHGSYIGGLDGKYVFGDYAKDISTPSGRLFVADLDTGVIQELALNVPKFFIKGLGEDDQGRIYVMGSLLAGYNGTDTTGVVYLLVPEPGSLLLLGLAGGASLLRRRRA